MATAIDNDTVLDGRYRIEARVGVGGMATVYRAWDELLRRHVAVKLLHASRAADPTFVERFKREASATANLAHPNIVGVYTWGASDDTYYIVMEYVAGANLKQVIQEQGPLPESEALAIADQVADALTTAHARGIVHRDITPHNILRTSDGQVKVTDFGIAHAAGSTHLTTAHTVLGTAHYLSPEQALHQPVDGRADLYSLGVVLYELLTGRPPFSGDSVATVALQHAYVEAPSPRPHHPGLSAQTEEMVCRLLAKHPDERYQSATELRDAIAVARADAEERREVTIALPLAVPPGVPVSPMPPKRVSLSGFHRRRWLFALPVLAVLLLLVVAHRSSGPTFSDIRVAASTTTPGSAQRTAPATIAPPTQPAPTPTTLPSPTATAPPPTATVIPPTATPPPASVIVQAPRPQEAVLGYYMFVAAHQFDRAAALWSPQLQATSPPAQAINARYAQIDHITVEHWEVTAQTADRATVAITVDEYDKGATTPRRYMGNWQLVHADVGWLLDAQQMNSA